MMWELQFEIETSCSLNCVHCSSLEMRKQEIRSYTDDDLLNFVKLFKSSLHIYFTGGEPINYSRLSILCNEIQKNAYNAKIGIYSTGNHSKQIYINEDLAKELKKSGVVDCYFSIYSDIEEEHDEWTGMKGSFINTIASINSIKKVGIIPKAHIVLTRINRAKIDKVIENNKAAKVECLCREGVCGTCETAILEGEADHRDQYFSDEERASQQSMLICCSRAKGKRLVLDL